VTAGSAAALGLPFQPEIKVEEIAVRYDAMPLDMAIHNPSSYAAFAQHARYRADTRYGELRQEPLPGSGKKEIHGQYPHFHHRLPAGCRRR
jgi:hypothetical protein